MTRYDLRRVLIALLAVSFFTFVAMRPSGDLPASVQRDTKADSSANAFALVDQALPGLLVGVLLQLVLVVWLGWFPTWGSGSIEHFVLPAIDLSWFSMAASVRLTRNSMLEVPDADQVRFARRQGHPERAVIIRCSRCNAAGSPVTPRRFARRN